MCRYLSYTYPEEWKKLSHDALGGSHWSVMNANFSESLKSGFFSRLPDEKIKQFKRFRLLNMYLMGAVILLQLALGLS